jgi:hypothetical protein
MGRHTIPWDQVKQEYTCGTVNEQGQRVWPTLNELAKKYRISYSTLWKRKTSERWDDLKEQNRITIEQESNKKYIGKVADEVERARAMLVISAVIDTSEPRTGDRGRLRCRSPKSGAFVC